MSKDTAAAEKPAEHDEQSQANALAERPERTRGASALSSGIPISSYREAMMMAEVFAESDLVPDDYKRKPKNCLVAMQHGAEVGLGPLQAIQNIAVVNGRPAVWGDAIKALCQAHPLYEWSRQEWDPEEQAAYTTMKRRGEPEHTVRFGMDDARLAKVRTKNGTITLAEKDTYKSHPEAMCRRRSLARCASFVFADALKGLAPADEVMDFIEGQAERVEPASASERTRERIAAKRAPARPAPDSEPETSGETAPATVDGETAPEPADEAKTPAPSEEAVAKWIAAAADMDELNELNAAIRDVAESDARGRLRKAQSKRAKELAGANGNGGGEGAKA